MITCTIDFYSRKVILYIILLISVPRKVPGGASSPQCQVFGDTLFGGSFVDCSTAKLKKEDLKFLDFKNATTLILSYNIIETIPNNSLSNFKELRRLDCTKCLLKSLEVDSLKGLSKLESLNMDINNLVFRLKPYKRGCFKHVPRLKSLSILHNSNYDFKAASYTPYIDIFTSLPRLEELSIDSFSNLSIGAEFEEFKMLKNLQIGCNYLEQILNNSLAGLQNSNITRFEMVSISDSDLHSYSIGFDVFQFLPRSVTHLGILSFHLGNRNALHMLKPLKGRNFERIVFNSTFSTTHYSFNQKLEDNIVTAESLKYLSKICLKHTLWYDSRITAIDTQALLQSPTWQNCVVSIYIQTNSIDLTVGYIVWIMASHMKKLQRITHAIIGNNLIKHFWKHELANSLTSNHLAHDIKTTNFQAFSEDLRIKKYSHYNQYSGRFEEVCKSLFGSGVKTDKGTHECVCFEEPIKNTIRLNGENDVNTVKRSNKNIGSMLEHDMNDEHPSLDRKLLRKENNLRKDTTMLTISLPPDLLEISFDGNDQLRSHIPITIRPNNVTSISITNVIHHIMFFSNISGLDRLQTMDFQGSKLVVKPEFFKQFPSLKKLILRRTRADGNSIIDMFGHECMKNIPLLEYLDIAENGLNCLNEGIFHTNFNLKYLCLASNKFTNIPFDLEMTPKLEILDLRGNMISGLSKEDRSAIDDHIQRVHNFTILLDHNELSCSCSALPFISWLNTHAVYLDRFGNYRCLSEDGTFSWTGSYKDINSFWRICHGKYQFLISLVTACALLASYLGIFLAMKHRTRIVSKMIQAITPGFKPRTREEFMYDVFIGYADQEGLYVRNVLLRYLEDIWDLNTFVHQRDLLHDPLLMSTALRESWRCLLIITENFLQHYDMAHNVMKVACFFVSPSNPRNVVVMVEENVQHQIPDYVLQVVDEDNILVLPKMKGFLEYQDKEILRSRLLM